MDPAATATLKTIAARVGTSVSTVSRVLGGQGERYRISSETAARIRAAAVELNFSPNLLAKGLRLRRTQTIGLVIPDISNPFFAAITRIVTVEARNRGYSLLLCDTQEDTAREVEAIALLQNRMIEGLIVLPVGQQGDHVAALAGGPLPVVLVDRYFPDVALPYVASDNRQGALIATRHLLERGHRRIACITGLPGTTPNEDRVGGYRAALAEAGVAADERLIVGGTFGSSTGYQEAKLLVSRFKDLTAILALSNLIGLGVLQALSEEGIGIPERISLISFDDQPYAAYLATPMTAVRQRNEEMGQLAVKLLFDRIQGRSAAHAEGIILPAELITRRSVRDLRALPAG
jgi:LacI family transcriptional regulator